MHQLLPDAAVLARELRQAQAPSLADLPAQEEKGRQALLSSLAMHAARAFADPRSEIAKDRWDLTVLGHHGWLAFTGISRNGCASPSRHGPPTTCRGGGASRPAPGCTRSSAR